jgi:hypothetical protein
VFVNIDSGLLYRQTICGICEPCRAVGRRSDVISSFRDVVRRSPSSAPPVTTHSTETPPSPSVTCCHRQKNVGKSDYRCTNLQNDETKQTLLNRFGVLKYNLNKKRLRRERSCCGGSFEQSGETEDVGGTDDVTRRVWPGNSTETGQRVSVEGEEIFQEVGVPAASSSPPASAAAVSGGHKRTGLSREHRARTMSNCSF